MTTPTKSTIIGRYQNDAQRNDFLQLENRDGGSVFGGINGTGFRYGTLAAGNIQGVLVKTSDYVVSSDDNGQLISVDSSGTVNLTLPSIVPDEPWLIQVQCVGTGNVIIHSTAQIDEASATITLTQNQGLMIVSDGSAYFTQRGIGGGSGTGFAGVSTQTNDYTALSADVGKLITFSKATAVQLTLPAVAPGSTWFVYVQNRGAGLLTINRNGLNIDGAAQNLFVQENSGLIVYCDGSNYFTSRGIAAIGSVNSQTNDYTALPTDTGKLISFNKSSAVQLTLPATSPGPYWFVMVQDVGAGGLTINRNGLTIDGAASNLSLTTGQGIIIYTDGTNYFTSRGSGTASNVAIKPAAASGIQYVAVATGNDSNDGLSWGTAKLTIMAAYDALPAGGGVVFIDGQGVDSTQWPACTSTANQGIWIMGPTDPNYASPPAGWRKAKNGGNVQVAFIGVPSSVAVANAMSGNMSGIIGPNFDTHPTIWLSGVSGVTFRNLASQYPQSFARIGVNSNGNKNDGCGGSDITFDNCSGNVGGGSSAYGPVFDIGPNLFWVRLTNCACQCNALADANTAQRAAIAIDEGSAPVATVTAVQLTGNVATYTANNEIFVGDGVEVNVTGIATAGGVFNVVNATVLSVTPTQFTVAITHADVGPTSVSGTATPGTNTASGILYFENCHFTGGGGIRYVNNHQGTAGHFVKNCESEGAGNSQPLYDVLSAVGAFSATLIFSEGISDSGDSPPKVRVAVGVSTWAVKVYGAAGLNNMDLAGPMTFYGQSGLTTISTGGTDVGTIPIGITSPQAQNQKGSVFAKTLDQGDWARRMFGLTLARYTNLADQNPGNWTTHGSGAVTSGKTAPDGTTNAAEVTGSDPLSDIAIAGPGTLTFHAGDYLYFGVWMKMIPPPLDSVQSPSPGIWFPFGDPGIGSRLLCGSYNTSNIFGFLTCAAPVQTDGEWSWVWGVLKCTTEAPAPYGPWVALPSMAAGAVASHKVHYYNPIMCQIPSTAVQVVANSTIAGAGTPGAQQTGHVVTITTTGAHGLVPGMLVCIKGVTAAGYNGEFAVRSCPSSTTFTYYLTATGLGNSGSGTVVPGNDSEVAEWAMNAASYSNLLTAGPIVATPLNVPLAFGGTGDRFFAILDHTTLTANRTISVPDGSGNLVLTSAANVFTPAQEFDGGVKIGSGGTTLTQAVVYLANLTPGSVSGNTSAEQDFSVAGVTTSDTIAVAGPAPTAGTGIVNVRVKSNGVVSITFGNYTGGGLTPTAGIYRIIAFRS